MRRALLSIWLGILFHAPEAIARVGGGHSYSGGHSSGGGYHSSGGGYHGSYSSASGTGSGGDLYFLFDAIARLFRGMIWLTFHRPLLGLPLDGVLIFFAWRILAAFNHPGYDITNDTASGPQDQLIRNARVSAAKARLDQLRAQQDPNFSQILLMDFLHALYSAIHHARGSGKLVSYSGYLSTEAVQSLKSLNSGVREVKGVVVGSAAVIEASAIQSDQPTTIVVEFEANYTEESVTGAAAQSWYAHETWKLSRKPGVLSREPARIRQIVCPACGAPPSFNEQGVCSHCGNQVRSGDFDWYVERVESSREKRPPLLTSDVAEEGNDLPTLTDPHFSAEKAAFQEQDPDFRWDRFLERASLIFMQLQKAWSSRKWEVVRPFETDCLFDTHSFWIGEYRRQKLVNELGDIQIRKLVPVKVSQDKYYAAITLRIYASMIDCTKDEAGKLITGSASRPRTFTEYWTFVRGRSAQPPKAGAGDLNCPACGAPLKINMAGNCEYCQAKVTAGDFDWVLSSIEQDEAYAG
jgi:hypothetical protein